MKQHANIDFSQFSDKDFDEAVGKVQNQLTTNGASFPGLPVSGATIGTNLTAYRTIADKPIYPEKTADLRAARLLLEDNMRKDGNHVNTIADGDLVLLAKSGYPLSALHGPVGPLAQASFKNINSIPGGFEIEINKVPNALLYMVVVMPSEDLLPAGKGHVVVNKPSKWPWYNSTTTKLKITDLDFGVKYTLRVVAIGTDPTLNFSDAVERTTRAD